MDTSRKLLAGREARGLGKANSRAGIDRESPYASAFRQRDRIWRQLVIHGCWLVRHDLSVEVRDVLMRYCWRQTWGRCIDSGGSYSDVTERPAFGDDDKGPGGQIEY
jgi:hypothetical protein